MNPKINYYQFIKVISLNFQTIFYLLFCYCRRQLIAFQIKRIRIWIIVLIIFRIIIRFTVSPCGLSPFQVPKTCHFQLDKWNRVHFSSWKVAFLAKFSHLDPDPGEKIYFTHQKILELYPCLYPVQVQSFFGLGPKTDLKGLW